MVVKGSRVIWAALVLFLVLSPPARAQEVELQTDLVPTKLVAGVDYRRHIVHGRLELPDSLAIDELERKTSLDPCIADRQIDLSINRSKRPDLFVDSVRTGENGEWRLRVKRPVGIVLATVQEVRFAYSPGYGYGDVREVVCEAIERERLRPAKVLGLRIRRGELPYTGLQTDAWMLAGSICALAGGFLMLVGSRMKPS